MDYQPILDNLKLFLDVLGIFRDAYRALRAQGEPGTKIQVEEKVLDEAIQRAEAMSAAGADAKKVLQEIEVKLETELGPAAKSEIIERAFSILTLARPLELKAFECYQQLRRVLDSVRTFCETKNIFQLRGELSNGEGSLHLPTVGAVLRPLLEAQAPLADDFRSPETIRVSIAGVTAILSTKEERLYLLVVVQAARTDHVGGIHSQGGFYMLSLTSGSQVNRIGFHIEQRPERSWIRDFEIRLSGEEFKRLVLAVLGDIGNYASELLREEKQFTQEIGPALDSLLSALGQPKTP